MGGCGSKNKYAHVGPTLFMGQVVEQYDADKEIAELVPEGGYVDFDAAYEEDPERAELGMGRLGAPIGTFLRKSDKKRAAVKVVTEKDATYVEMQRLVLVHLKLRDEIKYRTGVPVFDACLSLKKKELRICTGIAAGGALLPYCKNVKPWTEAAIAPLMAKLLMQVAAFHGAGIVHRGIRAENILCQTADDIGHPLIGGWTLACPTERHHAEPKESVFFADKHHDFLYTAPELFNCEKPSRLISGKQDIWALGCFFHILLFGRSPVTIEDDDSYDDKSKVARAIADLKRSKAESAYDETTVGALSRTITAVCAAVLREMLVVDPDKRPEAKDLLKYKFFVSEKPCVKDRKLAEKALDEFIERRLHHPEYARCAAHDNFKKVMRKGHAAGLARNKDVHARVEGKQRLF